MRALPVRGHPTRASVLTALASLALIVPFAVVAIRYAVTPGTVYLSDDLALVDLHVRDALHWQQQLGPFDRFGWAHPGPAVFYLLSVFARILGSGARAEFVGAIVINLLAALATIWVVRRRAGPLPALWCSVCLGVLAAVLGSTSAGATTLSESPLGALVTPWNPDVVIFPLVLFCVLAAAGASGSVLSLLGATLVGSFVVQTNFSTLPIAAIFLVAAAAWASVVKVLQRRRSEAQAERIPKPRDPLEASAGLTGPVAVSLGRRWPSQILLGAAGTVLLVVMWIPPLVQQFTHRPGNLTLIWRFFTSSHPTVSISHSLWAVLAVDAELPFGVAQEMSSRRLGQAHPREVLVLVLVLLVGALALLLGNRRRAPWSAALGAGSLLGLVVAVASVTRIVGPVYGYLIVWEVAVPLAALIGLGSAVLWTETAVRAAVPDRSAVRAARASGTVPAALVVLTVVVGSLLTVETSDVPPLQRASDPTVAAAWRLVSEHVRPGREHIFVGDAGTNIDGLFTFFGLVDQLQEHGYHPRVSPLWSTQVGPQLVSDNREPLQIVLYPPSARARAMSGYIGQTRYADIRVAPGPPTP